MNSSRMERLLLEYSNVSERKKEIEKLVLQEEERINNIRDTLRAPKNDGMPHSINITDVVYKAVQKIIDDCSTHLNYYRQQLNQLNDIERIILKGFLNLTETEYKIIELRYLKGYSWNAIFPLVSYQEAQCYRIRNEALEKLCSAVSQHDSFL